MCLANIFNCICRGIFFFEFMQRTMLRMDFARVHQRVSNVQFNFFKKTFFQWHSKNLYTARSTTEAKATRFIEIIGYRCIRYSIIERLYALLDIKIHFYYREYISRNLFAHFLRRLCLKSKLSGTIIDNFYCPEQA